MKKTCYSAQELNEFKEIVLGKLKQAEEELATFKNQLKGYEGNVGKMLDVAAENQEKESISLLAVRQQKFIAQLKAALVRIENGTYGVCRETGKLIPKERLRIVPHTTLCVEEKERVAA